MNFLAYAGKCVIDLLMVPVRFINAIISFSASKFAAVATNEAFTGYIVIALLSVAAYAFGAPTAVVYALVMTRVVLGLTMVFSLAVAWIFGHRGFRTAGTAY